MPGNALYFGVLHTEKKIITERGRLSTRITSDNKMIDIAVS